MSIYLAGAIGRPQAHSLMEQLTQQAVASGKDLAAAVIDSVKTAAKTDARLQDKIDLSVLQTLFDPVAATAPAEALAGRQLQTLRATVDALQALTALA